jgi:hypothetical protein
MAVIFDYVLGKLRLSDSGAATAAQVSYDSSANCSAATNVQDIIDELGNHEKIITYYEVVGGASSPNTITVPSSGTIILDKFGASKDAILTEIDGSNNPTWETPKTAGGTIVTTSLDVAGNYVFSGTPASANVAIIYVFRIPNFCLANVDLDFVINETEAELTKERVKSLYESNPDTNAYTDSEVIKLSGIATAAEVNVQSDWNAISGDAFIQNKPTTLPPGLHASTHTNGTDDIQDATAAQKGLATATQITKLDGVETSATADQSDVEIETAYNNQVSVVLQAEAEAGVSSTVRRWTAERVKQAIAALQSINIYGSNLQRFSASAEVNTSAPHNTWVNRINVNTTSLEAGDYELVLSYGWNHNATNSDFESRLSFDGAILGDIFSNGTTHKQEPKDSAGSGGSSGSSQQFVFTKIFTLNGLTVGVKPIIFDFRSDDSSDLSTTWDIYIKLIRVV